MLARNIQRRGGGRHERPAGERYVQNVFFPFFLDSGRVWGWDQFRYVHTFYSFLLPIIDQYSSMDVTTYKKYRRGGIFFYADDNSK